MQPKSTLRSFLLAAGSSLLAISSASAQLYWDDNGTTAGAGGTPTGTWGTDANWNTDPTGGAGGALQSATLSTDDLFIVAGPSATSGNANTTITVSGAQVAQSLGFQHSGNFTLSGTGSITLGAGGINIGQFAYGSTAQGTVQIGANATTAATFLTLGAAQTWTVDRTLSILANNATLGGSGNLTTAGSGRISIQGDNTGFSGDVLVSGGELEARTNITNTGGSLGTGNIEINGGVLGLYFNNTLTRALGSADGEIRISDGVSGFSGNGATGSTFTITNGGNPLQWGSTNFNPTELMLQRSTANADGKGTLASAIDLNGDGDTPDINGVVWRTIRSDQTGDNLTSGHGTLSGNLTNSGTTNTAGLIKTGMGHHILSGTNTYNGGTQVNQGTLTASTTGALPGWDVSGKTTVASGATLGVTPGASWTSANIDTLRGIVSWGSATSALGLNVTSNFTYASNVSGPYSIIKYGASTLTLNGDLSGLGGSLILAGGTIARSSGNLVTSSIEARDGTISAAIGGTTAVTKTTAGAVVLSGASTYSGGLTLNAGQINNVLGTYAGFGDGLFTVNGTTCNLRHTGNTATIPNNVKFNADSRLSVDRSAGVSPVVTWTGDVELAGNATFSSGGATSAVTSIFEGDISGAFSMTFNATRTNENVLTLSGDNTFSGGLITTGAGVLNINSPTALGTGTFTHGGGGNLNNTSGSAITLSNNNPQNWNSNFTFVGSSDLNMGAGAVTMNANRTVTVSAGTFTVGGAIGQDVAGRTLTKAGAGTLVLGGASTYSGATTVQQGNLVAAANAPSGSAGAFGNATSEIVLGVAGGNNAVGILISGGNHNIGRAIRNATSNSSDAGTRVLTLGGNSAHDSAFSGNIFLGTTNNTSKGIQLTAAAGGQVTFSGVIQNPTGQDAAEAAAAAALHAVTKVGAGIVVLSNANTYTGATFVNEGTLKLGANDVLPNPSPVSIGTATLDADTRTDTVGLLDVTGSAVINLGSGSALAFADSSAVDWTDISGTLNITGAFVAGNGVDPGVGSNPGSIRFGTTSGGLTTIQLSKISVNGSGLGTYTLDSYGYLTSGGGGSAYDTWASAKGLTGAPGFENGKGDDPDGDGRNNLYEFAFDGHPLSAANDGKIVGKVATVGANQVMTLTLPVRNGATFSTSSGDLLSGPTDGIYYRIEGSVDLGSFNKNIAEVTPAITDGLPSPLTSGWSYRTFTFAAPDTVPTVSKAFLRAKVSETP